MAVLRGSRQSVRGESSRGLFVVKVWRGRLVAQKWPRPKKRKRTQAERERERTFAHVAQLVKRQPAKLLAQVREKARAAPVYARDLMTQAAYGRFATLEANDGKVYYPVAYRDDVSYSLDALGQEEGTLARREGEGWRALPPGEEGQVLTMVGGLPSWAGAGPPPPPPEDVMWTPLALVSLAGVPAAQLVATWGTAYDFIRLRGWAACAGSVLNSVMVELSPDGGLTWRNGATDNEFVFWEMNSAGSAVQQSSAGIHGIPIMRRPGSTAVYTGQFDHQLLFTNDATRHSMLRGIATMTMESLGHRGWLAAGRCKFNETHNAVRLVQDAGANLLDAVLEVSGSNFEAPS